MTDATPQGWFDGVVGVLIVFFGYVLNLYRRKIDDMEKSFVSREELQELLREGRLSSEAKHQENREAMVNLTGRIDRVLERIK